MRWNSRFMQITLAAMAALALLTGALNLRSAIGSDRPGDWVVDPARQSQIDLLVGAPIRTPGDLDSHIVSLQDELRAHPKNGQAATLLGHAYLQKARETGDPSYYPKAEELFSIALDVDADDEFAMVGRGNLALARHQFEEALTWGERAKDANPYAPAAFAVIGDALIELGRYDEAVQVVQQMVDLRPELSSFARVSYLRELYGDVPGAIEAMQQAATAGAALPENVAWTHVQLGNLAFSTGDLDGAAASYEAALFAVDEYVYATAGLARIAAAQRDFDGAIELYGQAIARMPLPEFVIALGEVYLAAGRPAEAERQFALVDAMILLYDEAGVATDIELALFLADHGDDPNRAVELARAGYEARPNVKSADVLAWALYRAGEYEDASTFSREALRLGTRDALMHFHAGKIEAALGNHSAARDHFAQALAINPHFSPLYANDAADEMHRH